MDEKNAGGAGAQYKPYIPADRLIPELTPFSLVLGLLLAVVFGAANAYLGLRVGQTISASIPAAVISMGIIRGVFKRDSILENNVVQTIGSAGESVAGGAIFTLPVLFLWAKEWGQGSPNYLLITTLALAGGILGVLFMVPLRKALIVNEHETLPYPEGTACAGVLMAGETGGSKAKTTFIGLGVGAVYKFVADGVLLFPSKVMWGLKNFKGTGFGLDALPALLGVGYIIGPRIASFMFGGAVLGWFGIMPLLYFFGAGVPEAIYPATVPIAAMDYNDLWSNYLRYIGAGAVAFGGVYSLVSSLPTIVSSFKASLGGFKSAGQGGALRTDQDIGIKTILIGTLAVLVMLATPLTSMGILGVVLVLVFGFFFSTVAARIVGMIGSSNSPVSGMTIAALLIITMLFKVMGRSDQGSMVTIISIASVICIIAAISGDTSQDLKTGYLVGATPRKQQVGELLGVGVAAATIGGALMLLDRAWGFGSAEIPAVQATLMKLIVEGIMLGDLPWVLVLAGMGIGLMLAILKLPVLAVAIGLYLPITLSAPIMCGGLVRLFLNRLLKKPGVSPQQAGEKIESGMLYCSGLIAGEGLVGILLAGLTVLGVNLSPGGGEPLLGKAVSCIAFALLVASLLKQSYWKKTSPLQKDAS